MHGRFVGCVLTHQSPTASRTLHPTPSPRYCVAMPDYRRLYRPGGTYFFTLVTHDRMEILTTPFARECLRSAIAECQRTRPFEIAAVVLLPDHLHCIWTLPD